MKQARKLPICLLSVCCILYADVHSQTIKRRENQNLEVRQDQDALLVVKLTDVVSEAVQLWKHPEKPVPKNSDVLDLRLPPMVYDAIFIEDLLYVLFASEGELKVDVLRKGEHETYQSLKIYTFQTTFAVGANEGRRFAESANIEVADGDISVELIESGGKKLRWRGRGNGDSVTWESIKSLPSARKSDSSLLDAAGSVEKLEAFIAAGGEVDSVSKDNQNMTILMRAAGDGSVQMINALLESGASLDTKDDKGRTALSWAIKSGNKEAVEKLLDEGATVGSGEQLLHRAVAYATDPGILELLVKNGAKLEERSDDLTPLMMAARDGKSKMLKELLRLGSKKDAATAKGKKAIDLARERPRNSEIIKALRQEQE